MAMKLIKKMRISVIKKMLSFLCSNDNNRVVDDTLVIAGNPAKKIHPIELNESLTEKDEKLVQGLKRMKICGNSMAPCGIYNGDVVYVESKSSSDIIRLNSFVILQVDKEKYTEPVLFNHKLRRYLMDMSKDMSFDNVVENLTKFHKYILSRKYQERLHKKIQEKLQEYPEEKDFCISLTFREGSLRYSVHPRNLIEGCVKFVINTRENNTLLDVENIEAY